MRYLDLEKQLTHRANQDLLRYRMPVEASPDRHLVMAGKRYLNFSSNNYLGLAKHPAVIKACQRALTAYGVGSGSAYLVTGYTCVHQDLEEGLANFLGYPRVLLLSSGYLANIGVISALFGKNDIIFSDKLNHASLLDGCLISKARLKRYPHCSVKVLEAYLTTYNQGNKLIVSEGVFGMDGTLAPLKQLSTIAALHQAWIWVDDAHGIGVIGKTGQGSLEYHGLGVNEVPLLIGTLGKAFGTYGAFVAGKSLLIESLIQTTRTYLYTTAIPPAIAAASLASLKLIEKESWRREKLSALIAYFKQRVKEYALPCLNSDTPIQGVLLGSSKKALKISQKLALSGIYAKAIRPPTVPHLKARLRVTLTAEHMPEDIDLLVRALADAIKAS